MSATAPCTLCKETATEGVRADEFAVLASIGALSLGHSLLCPTIHARSVAALPQTLAERLFRAAPDLARRLTDVVGRPVHAFEHGNASCGTRIACSVEHAHMHLLPANVEIRGRLEEHGRWEPLREWSAQELVASTRGSEYLLYRAPDGDALLWITEREQIPSQLMRRIMANALGHSDQWNWRDSPAAELTEETRALVSHLAEERAPVATLSA